MGRGPGTKWFGVGGVGVFELGLKAFPGTYFAPISRGGGLPGREAHGLPPAHFPAPRAGRLVAGAGESGRGSAAALSGLPGGARRRSAADRLPRSEHSYRLRRDAPPEHQRIPLIARASPGASRLFWYQDGQLVAAVALQEGHFLESVPGEHRLVMTDDLGRSDAVTYRVE